MKESRLYKRNKLKRTLRAGALVITGIAGAFIDPTITVWSFIVAIIAYNE